MARSITPTHRLAHRPAKVSKFGRYIFTTKPPGYTYANTKTAPSIRTGPLICLDLFDLFGGDPARFHLRPNIGFPALMVAVEFFREVVRNGAGNGFVPQQRIGPRLQEREVL